MLSEASESPVGHAIPTAPPHRDTHQPASASSSPPVGQPAGRAPEPTEQTSHSGEQQLAVARASFGTASPRLSASPSSPPDSGAQSTSSPAGSPSAPVRSRVKSTSVPRPRGCGGAGTAHPRAKRPTNKSVTGSLFRTSATAGLSRSPAMGPAGGGTVVDLRTVDLSSSRSRGGRSPMITPGTAGSAHSTPMLRSLRKGVEPPSRILDFLFLGSVHDAQDAAFLSRNHVVCIINVSTEEYWSADNSIVVHTFKVQDTVDSDITVHFKPSSLVIERVRRLHYDAKRKGHTDAPTVLVHCQKGRSRSPTIVLAYLIARNGWSVAEALEYVSKRRRQVEPNFTFMDALRELQESMSTEERTKRYGMQILRVKGMSSATRPETVKAFFEERVGCVRDVVMHARNHGPLCPAAAGSNGAAAAAAADAQGEGCCEGGTACDEDALCLVCFACFEDVKRARDYAHRHPDELVQLGPVPGKEIKLSVPPKPNSGSSLSTSGNFDGSTHSSAPRRPTTTSGAV